MPRCSQWTGAWRERQRIQKLVRRMGKDGGTARAWRQWESVVEMNAYLKGCIGRFAKSGLSRAYNRWLEALEEKAAMRRFVEGVVAKELVFKVSCSGITNPRRKPRIR